MGSHCQCNKFNGLQWYSFLPRKFDRYFYSKIYTIQRMTNQELRARTAILPEFASMAMNAGEQLQDAQLSKGFVPMELQALVDEAITGAAPTFSDRPLTDLELSTLDTWFVAHPEKIAGTQVAGSGYIAPVRTRGNMEDLERVFAFLDEEVVQSSEFNVQSEPVLNSQTANLTFVTHTEEVVSGQRLVDAINKVADNMVVSANKKRIEHYASHITETQKDEFLVKDLKYAEEVRRGEHLNNFSIWQRIDTELTGETAPLFANSEQPKPIDKAKIKAKAKAKALVLALELEKERV